jgi:hypothetical protein
MATPWETMKQQPIGNALGKQAKLWSAPPTIKEGCPTRPRVQLLLPEPLSADGFRVCHFTLGGAVTKALEHQQSFDPKSPSNRYSYSTFLESL